MVAVCAAAALLVAGACAPGGDEVDAGSAPSVTAPGAAMAVRPLIEEMKNPTIDGVSFADQGLPDGCRTPAEDVTAAADVFAHRMAGPQCYRLGPQLATGEDFADVELVADLPIDGEGNETLRGWQLVLVVGDGDAAERVRAAFGQCQRKDPLCPSGRVALVGRTGYVMSSAPVAPEMEVTAGARMVFPGDQLYEVADGPDERIVDFVAAIRSS